MRSFLRILTSAYLAYVSVRQLIMYICDSVEKKYHATMMTEKFCSASAKYAV